MATFDLVIKNGTLVTPRGEQLLEIGICGGKIAELSPQIISDDSPTIDAAECLIFPGLIDPHTHMGIPIKDTHSADDFETGSKAAAFGGVTTILDFTVQQPGQTLRAALNQRITRAHKSKVDVGLHINLTDRPVERLNEIPGLIRDGFSSFKLFSTYREAGMMATWDQFRTVLRMVSENGGLVMLHAEDNHLVETMTRMHITNGEWAPIFHAYSRPPEAEAQAIGDAAKIARELDAPLYIVHVSSRLGLEAGLEARARGTKIYLETCPQYLMLDEFCYYQPHGHYFIATPPLRSQEDRQTLWKALNNGDIDTIGTDHCPFTKAQKDVGRGDFNLTPNGLAGVETILPLLYTHGVVPGRISRLKLAELVAGNAARIFGLADRKGKIAEGTDADLVVWDPTVQSVIRSENLHGADDWSPYEGHASMGVVRYTIRRGEILVDHGMWLENTGPGEIVTSHPIGI